MAISKVLWSYQVKITKGKAEFTGCVVTIQTQLIPTYSTEMIDILTHTVLSKNIVHHCLLGSSAAPSKFLVHCTGHC